MTAATQYSSKSITTLDGIEHVRLRPGVYLGEDIRTTAAREVVDNACDEVARGHASTVEVIFHPDESIEVSDDGRGVPFDYDEKTKINGIVKTLGTTMSGSNFDDTGAGAGTNGIGASATNAISSRFDVDVIRAGKRYTQRFREGRPGRFTGDEFDPGAPFERKDGENLRGRKDTSGRRSGTTVRFHFDPSIAPDSRLDTDDLAFRVGLTARLVDGMKLSITRNGTGDADENAETDHQTYSGPYGSAAALDYATGHKATTTFTGSYTYTSGQTERDVQFDVSLAPSPEQKIVSAVNSVYTPDGGAHVSGALRAVGAALTSRKVRGLSLAKGEDYPSGDDFVATCALSLSIRTPAPPFVGQDKRRLNPSARALSNGLERELARQLTVWVASPANNAAVTEWAEQALQHARTVRKVDAARAAARAANKKAGAGTNLSLPEKLLPSRKTGRGSGAELFICEGDSALGTVKNARSSEYQAAFPLRGKPINAHGRALGSPVASKAGTLRANEEFKSIEAILGTGVQEKCDPEKCRYDRVIFACDADPDGANISALLLEILYGSFRPLLDEGMIYVAVPPLFIITTDDPNERIYCVTESDRDEALERLRTDNRKKVEVQRCKGLGEMNPREFRETVMNPKTRTLIRIEADGDAESTLEMMFGPSAQARREWIDVMRERGITELVDTSD